MVVCLSFASVFWALTFLNLLGVGTPPWVDMLRYAVMGIYLTIMSIEALYSPPSPRFPNWTKWAMLAFGIGSILVVPVLGLHYYWH
jgi:hypothetical protein